MRLFSSFWPRVFTLLFASFAVFAGDTSAAYAQSNACSRLQSGLDQLSRSSDFQNLQSSDQGARQLQGQVQAAESAYVRNGCNDDAKAGRVLSRECQGIGRDVLRLREEFQQASASVNTGNAMAQQREAILQELARFGCGTNGGGGSSATFQQGNRQNLFDRIFGNSTDPQYQDGEVFEDNTFRGYGGRTVRTVCVRLSDGYFWPISYSTLPEYAAQDAVRCSEMCPSAQVELYMYDNPGQEPEQMRSMTDQPYTALPTAFRYREEIDMNNSCTAPNAGGTIATEGGRAMASYNGVSFPLPLRDPRRQQPVAAAVAVAAAEPAQFIDIPLPRRRPAGPGEAPLPEPVTAEAGEEDMRLVKFGDRTVRIVGPDTPYAQAEAAGT